MGRRVKKPVRIWFGPKKRSIKLDFSKNSLVLFGFFLVVGGLLMALRARRADESPQKNKSLMLSAVIVLAGLGFWAASLTVEG